MFLASVISPKEIVAYRSAFDGFDREHSGKVPNELLEPLLRSLGYDPYPEEVEDMVEDLGSYDSFDFDSFLVIVSRHSRSAKPDTGLSDVFRTISKDGCGRVSIELVKNALRNIPNKLSEEDINDLLRNVSVDNDDTADVDDIANALLGL